MTSTCPKCKKTIEHEDFLFEVVCDCGIRFNPFMDVETPVPQAQPAIAPPAWKEPESAASGFSESQSVFDELKEFAEGVGQGEEVEKGKASATAPAPASPSPKDPKAVMAPLVGRAVVPSPIQSDAMLTAIMTSGDSLPSYRIDSYLPPVSAAADLEATDSNPMRRGFDALWAQALQNGASGIVAVRWVLSPDGARVVLSGTPVRCSKEGT